MSVTYGRKLKFLDHPRTGGTSTQFALAKIGCKTFKRHTMVGGVAKITCSTVRNPYDLLVSWYVIIKARRQYKGTFLEFIKNYENYNFTRGGRLFYFTEASNEIMRFETLQVDLTKVLKKALLKNVVLKHENKTLGRRPYQEYYDDACKQALRERFQKDIEEFNYVF
jgi:hypothetical protein